MKKLFLGLMAVAALFIVGCNTGHDRYRDYNESRYQNDWRNNGPYDPYYQQRGPDYNPYYRHNGHQDEYWYDRYRDNRYRDEYDPHRYRNDYYNGDYRIYELHNSLRQRYNLRSMTPDKQLERMAQYHAMHMAKNNCISHYGYNYSTPEYRARQYGIYATYVGENLAVGGNSSYEVFKAWWNSADHRKKILAGYHRMGVGHATAHDGKVYWCMVYVR